MYVDELIKISGVGPRMALGILSGLSADELARAVSDQDAARLTKVPGIGKKTAERLVVELRAKVGASDGPSTLTSADTVAGSTADSAHQAG